MRTLHLIVGLGLALGALALAACDEDEFFMDCPLSQTIIETCEAQSETTSLTCVVESHPMCDEQICAKWKDSDPFCSRACVADTECPGGSTCQVYLDFSFCVPDTVRVPPIVQ